MAAPVASNLELQCLALQFHHLSNQLAVMSDNMDEFRDRDINAITRAQFDVLSHAAMSLRVIVAGSQNLLDEQAVAF